MELEPVNETRITEEKWDNDDKDSNELETLHQGLSILGNNDDQKSTYTSDSYVTEI